MTYYTQERLQNIDNICCIRTLVATETQTSHQEQLFPIPRIEQCSLVPRVLTRGRISTALSVGFRFQVSLHEMTRGTCGINQVSYTSVRQGIGMVFVNNSSLCWRGKYKVKSMNSWCFSNIKHQ